MEEVTPLYILLLAILVTATIGIYFTFKRFNKLDSKTKPFSVIFWNVFFTGYLLLIVLFIGESYYRFVKDSTDSFSINKVSKRWFKRHIQLNNFNVRDNTLYSYKIEPGKRRVSFIGDSFSQGHGVKNVDDRFSNILSEKKPNVEFHNLSVPGANSKTQLETLNDLLENGYEFDLIVLVYVLNDIDYLMTNSKDIYKRIHNFQNNLSFLERESYFINTLSFKLFALSDPDYKSYSDFVKTVYGNSLWEAHKLNLQKIKEFASSTNSNFCVITFPYLQKPYDQYDFKEIHNKLDAFWQSQQTRHLDLLDTYKSSLGKNLTVNSNDAHPNERAHKLASKAIGNFLFSN